MDDTPTRVDPTSENLSSCVRTDDNGVSMDQIRLLQQRLSICPGVLPFEPAFHARFEIRHVNAGYVIHAMQKFYNAVLTLKVAMAFDLVNHATRTTARREPLAVYKCKFRDGVHTTHFARSLRDDGRFFQSFLSASRNFMPPSMAR